MIAISEMTFGLMLPHWTGGMGGQTPRGRDVLTLARMAEQRGFDALWVADHFRCEPDVDLREYGNPLPEQYRGTQVGEWEGWTLLAALAVATERVAIGTLVTNTGYRNPALLAQMANTVDELSNGRLALGLGAGDFRSEHESHGYPWEGRVGRFEEALQIIRPMLRGETVTFTGQFYQTRAATVGLHGPRSDGPPVTIGLIVGKPRMQRLVVQYADVWSCWQAFGDSRAEAYRGTREAMEAACARHGRDPATLERHVSVAVVLPGREVRFPGEIPLPGATPLVGSQAQVAEQLAALADEGVGHVSIWLQPMTAEGIDWLARVLEGVRG